MTQSGTAVAVVSMLAHLTVAHPFLMGSREMRIRLLACVCLVLCLHAATTTTNGQTIHRDGKGYSIRAGDTIHRLRNDGSSSTHTRVGNWILHNFSNSTQGASYYGATGRWDKLVNEAHGWHSSRYTPHRNPSATTYRRHYYRQPSSNSPGPSSTTRSDRTAIHFRETHAKPTPQTRSPQTPWTNRGENWAVSGYGKRGRTNSGVKSSVSSFD